VELLATPSRDTLVDEGFVLRFRRVPATMAGARGSWTPIDAAAPDDAGEIYLHWASGGETVRVRFPWSPEAMRGYGSLRTRGVGIDLIATATRAVCEGR
jgi:hypothetical protein